ncbi:MAG TPA: adenylate/guanylate cyclase domain-containing protein [Roseimicrobium sp.]|nr:adenylate/guanylate cyclase domain-containing protein [Roseimicrobium sp.]
MRFLPRLGFRIKLLLAMMLVVAGVTAATLFVTQRKVQSTYQKLFEEQFRAQIAYFSERQQTRLGQATQMCLDVTGNVRVVAAAESGDAEIIYDNVYTALAQLGRNAVPANLPGGGPPSIVGAKESLPGRLANRLSKERPGAAAAVSKVAGIFVAVVDANGQTLKDPKDRPGKPRGKSGQQLQWFAQRSVTNLKAQEVGYLALDLDDARYLLREVIVTPIINIENGKTIAALVTGFPLLDLGEQIMNDMSHIRSGIWLEKRLFSKTVPESLHDSLSQQLEHEIATYKTPRDTFVVQVEGEPHRVFYKALNPDSTFPVAFQVGLYSLAAAEREKVDLRLKILGSSSVALLGALALSLLISRGLSEPLHELVRGTNEIQKGNFDVKVPVRSRDEIGELAASFNEMAVGLALKEKYHNVLNMVADKEVALQMMSGTVSLGGEVRKVSVLFCDIRGFTALTQNMPPAEVIQMLNEHMTVLTNVVYEHNGVVDKFVGDLIMAIFGAPKSYGQDSYNAARCALRMIEERNRINATGTHQIQIGIGVATGEVVAGCMGSSDRLNYTVLGERVNLASRLCSSAGRGEVVVDQSTFAELGELAEAEALPELQLKGFSEKVRAYRLGAIRSKTKST